MGTKQLAARVSAAATGSGSNLTGYQHTANPNVILLENHGIVCLGKNLLTAFDRLEVLEAAARMTFITGLSGGANPLNMEQLEAIDRMMML